MRHVIARVLAANGGEVECRRINRSATSFDSRTTSARANAARANTMSGPAIHFIATSPLGQQ